MLFNILFKKFEVKHFLLFSSSLSLIGLIFFCIFSITSWLPILCFSLLYIISNLIYIVVIYNVKAFEPDESLYATLIFTYSIFLGIISLIYKLFRCFCSLCKKRACNEESGKLFIILGVFALQHAFILLFVWLGYYYEWTSKDSNTFLVPYIIINIVNFIITIVLSYYFQSWEDGGRFFWFCMFFYELVMIIYYYYFSLETKEGGSILGFVIIMFFKIFSGFLCIFLSGSSSILSMICFFLLSDIISITLIHFYWLQNTTSLIWFTVLSIIVDIFYLVVLYLVALENSRGGVVFSVVLLDYCFFYAVYYSLRELLVCICH